MKQQFFILKFAYYSIGYALHESFHAIMAFILNVELLSFKIHVENSMLKDSFNKCGYVEYSCKSPIKVILICSAPPLFTIILMVINLIFENYFIYCFLSSYFLCGILRCSDGDWENIKDSFRKIKRDLKFRNIKFLRKYKFL